MKHRILTYTALALLLGLTACTQDSQMTEGAEGTPMTFTATGLDFNEAHTRATVDNDWEGVNTVAVKIGDVTKAYTVNATEEDNKATARLTSNTPFYWTSSSQTVTAWYPYTSEETAMPDVVVEADQSSTGFAASDFLAAEDQTVSIGAPTLKFVHRTARIAVTLTTEDAITVRGATVKFTNLDTTHVNPATITSHNVARTVVYEALVAPQTIASGKIFIVVTLNDANKTTYTYVPQTATKLEAGKQYTYTLRIKDNKLEFTGCTITDWTTGSTPTGAIDYIVTADGTYIVYTAKGLYAWADATETKPATSCVLAKDITLPEAGEGKSNWEPVCPNNGNEYEGVFDGNGCTISNVTINNSQGSYVGFFGRVGNTSNKSGTIMNLTLKTVKINGGDFTGGLAGSALRSTIKNCNISGNITGGSNTGGITSYCHQSTITTCRSSVNISAQNFSGGVAGYNSSGATITDCHFIQEEDAKQQSQGVEVIGKEGVGGIVGSNNGTVTECSSSGTIRGNKNVGGVVGTATSSSQVTACSSTNSTITGTDYIGGIAGENTGTITDCSAETCTITSESDNLSYAGGIAGSNDGGNIKFSHASGTVSGTNGVGGVIGIGSNTTVVGSYFSGTVTGNMVVGGVAGGFSKTSTLTACYFHGTINGQTDLGAVVGSTSLDQISACYWSSDTEGLTGGTGSDITEVDGETVTWKTATARMNSFLNSEGREYIQADGQPHTLPTIQKKTTE